MCCTVSASSSCTQKNKYHNTIDQKGVKVIFWLHYVGVLQIKTTVKQSQQRHRTPGLRNRLRFLCSSAWFSWFPMQNFCRNRWVYLIISCIFTSFCIHTKREGLTADHVLNGWNVSINHSYTHLIVFTLAGERSHLVIRHLQQVQHDFMSSHVLQQPLLLLPHSAAAHLIEPLQDLLEETGSKGGMQNWKAVPKNIHLKNPPELNCMPLSNQLHLRTSQVTK